MADLGDITISLRVDDGDVVRSLKTFESMKRQIADLIIAQRKGEITKKQYNRAIQQMAQRLGKVTKDLNGAKSAVQKYAYAIKDATDEQLKFQAVSGKGMRRMEILAQQAGYQIGDLAVQIQSGTNAAVALGQQGSQMLGFFGPYGAMAGAALAIGTGLVAPLLKAKDAAEQAKREIRSLGEVATSLQGLKDLLEEAFDFDLKGSDAKLRELIGIQAAEQQFEMRAKVLAGFALVEKEVAASVEFMKEQIQDAKDEISVLRSDKGTMFAEENEQQIEALKTKIKELVVEINSSQKELDAFAPLIHTNVNEPLDETINKLVNFGVELSKNKTLQESMGLEFEAYLEHMGLTEIVADRLGDRLKEIKKATEGARDAAASYKNEMQGVMEHMALMDVIGIASARKGGGRGSVVPSAVDAMLQAQGGFDYKYKDPKGRQTKDPLTKLKEQINLEQALIGKTEARQKIIKALGVDFMKYGSENIANIEAQIEKTMELEAAEKQRIETLEEAKRQQEELKDTIESSMEDAFMSIIDGTKSVEDAFRMMARDIIAHLMRVYVVQKMISSFTGGIPFLNANGNAFSNGNVIPYANGGVVGGPTYFPMSGGRTGLMGEAGPEAIMPLKRGKDGKLGVTVDGGQQQSVVIHQSFNFAANGDDSVKRIIASEAPKIAKMTEAQILDNRRRGGQFRKAFS